MKCDIKAVLAVGAQVQLFLEQLYKAYKKLNLEVQLDKPT